MGIHNVQDMIKTKSSFGGKADGLAWLHRHGYAVPPFFVIDHDTLCADGASPGTLEEVLARWVDENAIAPHSLWAVRSSAAIEDGHDRSFAGQFRSEINCPLPDLAAAIRTVRAGFDVALTAGGDGTEATHIIVQHMLAPSVSGVIFSIDPLSPTDDAVVLDVIPGLGAPLVSGEEPGLHVRIRRGKPEPAADPSVFRGLRFKSGDEAFEMSRTELLESVQPHLSSLDRGIRAVARRKGHPVDAEFAIENGRLFWLQARPITSRPVETAAISTWDNANISANYPGLSSPLTISFVTHTYELAYTRLGRFLGGSAGFAKRNAHLFRQMSGGIRGSLYYNVTVWQRLLIQMPFGTHACRFITRTFGADDVPFTSPRLTRNPAAYARLCLNLFGSLLTYSGHKRRYLAAYERIEQTFKKREHVAESHAQLVDRFRSLESEMVEHWVAPMLNGLFTMMFFNGLKKALGGSRLHASHPNFVNDILQNSGDIVSITIVRELRSIIHAIASDPAAAEIFRNEKAAAVMPLLSATNPALHEQIGSYIGRYGDRSGEGELKLETVSYKDDPLLFIAFLRHNISTGPVLQERPTSFDYKDVVTKAYRFSPLKRFMLLQVIRLTVNRVRDRENFRFIRARCFAIVRASFRRMECALLATGSLAERRDVFYLTYDELLDPSLQASYRGLVSLRKQEYESYSASAIVDRYEQHGDAFIPVLAAATDGSGLRGTGCCSGVLTAEVIHVDENNLNEVDPDGKILVARHFEPGWIGLFARAAGMISEGGSLLSHTAILCREMGTPTIIGAKGARHKLPTGSRVRMNGATGTIEIITT
jgi:phosphohistidine swiveling domain-containing protein